jgi:uncharacterized membrane protein
MRKVLNYTTYFIYSSLCFGIAGYAFYFLLQPLDPNNGFQAKMFTSGIQVPIHFIASGIALFIVPFQLSKKLRKSSIKLHRHIGKIYTLAVVLGGISGLIMAFNASGGIYAKMGFTLLSLAWLYTTFFAVKYALAGNIAQHKRWIYRSIAVTSAAISLRLFLGIGLGVFQLPFFTVYIPASWFCWILNLIICEIILMKKKTKFNLNAVA